MITSWRMEEIIHANTIREKAGIAIFIWNKVDFKVRSFPIDKKGCLKMTHQFDRKTLQTNYTPMKMVHGGPARGSSRLRKWAGGHLGRIFGVWMFKHGIKSGCGCRVGRDFTPQGGVRRRRCRERQGQKKVLNRFLNRSLSGAWREGSPWLPSGTSRQASLQLLQTQRDNARAP